MKEKKIDIDRRNNYKICSICLIPQSLNRFTYSKASNVYACWCHDCKNQKIKEKRMEIRLKRKGLKKIRKIDIDIKNGNKTCNKCSETKLLIEFALIKKQNIYCSICKKCKNIQNSPGRKRQEEKRKISNYYCIYLKNRRKNDINFRLRTVLRSRLASALKYNTKAESTINLLGCDIDTFKLHLESQFQPGMTWDNYGFGNGKWVIDHIIPCASFDFCKEDSQKICFHYSNMQPLWWEDNVEKRDKLPTN